MAVTGLSVAGDTVANPAVIRLMGLARTPANTGLTVDPNDGTDATTALQSFLTAAFAAGDRALIPPGVYKTSDELVFGNNGAATRAYLEGYGATIHSTVTNKHIFRVNVGENSGPGGVLAGLHFKGPSALPTGGKAGLVLDHTPLFVVRDTDVQNTDIGYDLINNNFNSVFQNPSVRRFGGVNCGILIRTGSDCGNDLTFYNNNIFAQRMAINFQGDSSGIRFYGGQIGTDVSTFDGIDDARGVITMGKTYVADGSGVKSGGQGGVLFSGLTLESWKGKWAFRTFGEAVMSIHSCNFLPLASTSGQQALGMIKMTDPINSIISAQGNFIGSGYFSAAYGATCVLSGTLGDNFAVDEGMWSSGAVTCNSVLKDAMWFRGLGPEGLETTRGFSRWTEGGAYAVQKLGYARMRSDYDGPLQKSNDGGANWSNIET